MPEWLIGPVSKTGVPLTGYRGFESLSLRCTNTNRKPLCGCGYITTGFCEVAQSENGAGAWRRRPRFQCMCGPAHAAESSTPHS